MRYLILDPVSIARVGRATASTRPGLVFAAERQLAALEPVLSTRTEMEEVNESMALVGGTKVSSLGKS